MLLPLLRLRDRFSWRLPENRERKKPKESDRRERLQLLRTRQELRPKEKKERTDSKQRDRRLSEFKHNVRLSLKHTE